MECHNLILNTLKTKNIVGKVNKHIIIRVKNYYDHFCYLAY